MSNQPNVPVFIINRDLLEWPRAMVAEIRRMGATPIIVDTGTTHKPTADWYESDRHLMTLWCENHVQHTPWISGAVGSVMAESRYYVVTDPDLDISGCPDETIQHLINLLDRYGDIAKAGLSLEVNDFPDGSPVKQNAIGWETPFWQNQRDWQCYSAPIETTFAVYDRQRRINIGGPGFLDAIRADRPFTCRHLPFYLTEDYFPEDVWYYLKNASKVSTMARYLEGLVSKYDERYARSSGLTGQARP
jgi:hypothetical protein